jgi:hypothetical protein
MTAPSPVSEAPALMVSHVALLVAVHAHVAGAVTITEPVVAAATTLADAGEIVGTQAGAAWVTVNVEPAMVSVPVRLVVPVLAATLNVTGPDPEPEAPEVTVIHVALLAAVHRQPAATVTVLLPVPPAAATA